MLSYRRVAREDTRVIAAIAAEIFGGGVNAFSRYYNGKTKPRFRARATTQGIRQASRRQPSPEYPPPRLPRADVVGHLPKSGVQRYVHGWMRAYNFTTIHKFRFMHFAR